MNPLMWPLPHKVALGLSAVVGGVFGFVLAYFVTNASNGANDGPEFGSWISFPSQYLWWTLLGAVLGATILYIRQLTSS